MDGNAAKMMRHDLAAAGIPYAIEGPDGPLFADFHALRHSYLTLGGRAGIDLRTLQELAGHSTPVLTARYSHRRLHDLAGAVEKLPSVLSAPATARATGTEGASPTRDVLSLPPAYRTVEAGRGNLRPDESLSILSSKAPTNAQPQQSQVVASVCDRLSVAETGAGKSLRPETAGCGNRRPR
jgi:Phage integrase family